MSSIIYWFIIGVALLQPGDRTVSTFYMQEFGITLLMQCPLCFTAAAQNSSGISAAKVLSPGNVKMQNPEFFSEVCWVWSNPLWELLLRVKKKENKKCGLNLERLIAD